MNNGVMREMIYIRPIHLAEAASAIINYRRFAIMRNREEMATSVS